MNGAGRIAAQFGAACECVRWRDRHRYGRNTTVEVGASKRPNGLQTSLERVTARGRGVGGVEMLLGSMSTDGSIGCSLPARVAVLSLERLEDVDLGIEQGIVRRKAAIAESIQHRGQEGADNRGAGRDHP